MSEEQKRQLEQQLWNIANTLRGKMNADEFRDYILGFIFYKYLSERMNLYADEILESDGILYQNLDESTKDGKEMLDAVKEESLVKLGYFLKPSELFSEIARRGNADNENESSFILEDLGKILNNIEQSTMGTDSEDDFDNLFEDLDLTSTKLGRTEKAKNELISKVLAHLDKIDFQLEDSEADVLGDAYEYLIGKFASGAGKKAGEFYTPQQVSQVLAKIVTSGKTKLKSVYDPTCGSGSLLLRVAREVKEVGKFYGQESINTTYNLARMNMILHGVHYQKFDIKQEDSLERPQHFDKRFEAIVANPPFSQKWSASPLHLSDDRFSQYGRLAPKSYADFAFIQHMIHHLDENGIMAVIAPHGVLYRGSAEGHIRQYMIEDRNYIDAVIGLPPNIFYGTTYETCILVLKKCRENPDDILFIDASKDFGKKANQNYLRISDIQKIISTYQNRMTEDKKYSYRSPLSEIKENDFNLNIPRYVDYFEKEKIVDLNKVANDLEIIKKEVFTNQEKIEKLCESVNLPSPSTNNLPLINEFKKGVLQKIFSQEIRFKDENGNNFEDWQEMEFGRIFSFRPTNSFSRSNLNYKEGDVKNIHYGDIHIKFHSLFDINKEKVPFINKDISIERIAKDNYCKEGDLIIADASEDYKDVGKSIEIMNLNNEKVLAGLHTFLARPDKHKIVKGFSTYLMKSWYVRLQIMTIAQGSKVLGISKGNLAKIKLKIPSEPEQEKIAEFLTSLFLAIDNNIYFLNKKIEKGRLTATI